MFWRATPGTACVLPESFASFCCHEVPIVCVCLVKSEGPSLLTVSPLTSCSSLTLPSALSSMFFRRAFILIWPPLAVK